MANREPSSRQPELETEAVGLRTGTTTPSSTTRTESTSPPGGVEHLGLARVEEDDVVPKS